MSSLAPNAQLSRRAVLKGAAATLAITATPAFAQDTYPSRPIRIIVPYAPGGQGDVLARLIGERMTSVLGQTILVENQSGGSGALGARMAATAEPDGYSLLMGQTGEIVINPLVMAEPGYDPAKDFMPLSIVGNSALVLVVPAASPITDVASLLERAKAEPDTLTYASSGNATPGHLAALALSRGVGASMIHVPYRGAGQALTDVIGGQVDCFFSSAAAALGHVRSGTLKALAVSTPERVAALGDVPTVAETVLPGFSFSLWAGLFTQAKTPRAVIDRLSRTVNEILASPEIRQRLEEEGAAVAPMTPETFMAFVVDERVKYADLVAQTGVRAE